MTENGAAEVDELDVLDLLDTEPVELIEDENYDEDGAEEHFGPTDPHDAQDSALAGAS